MKESNCFHCFHLESALDRPNATNIYIGVWKHDLFTRPPKNGKPTNQPGISALNLRFGRLSGTGAIGSNVEKYEKECPRCRKGDIVEMIVTYNNKKECCEVKYVVNGKDYGIAYRFDRCRIRAFVGLFVVR